MQQSKVLRSAPFINQITSPKITLTNQIGICLVLESTNSTHCPGETIVTDTTLSQKGVHMRVQCPLAPRNPPRLYLWLGRTKVNYNTHRKSLSTEKWCEPREQQSWSGLVLGDHKPCVHIHVLLLVLSCIVLQLAAPLLDLGLTYTFFTNKQLRSGRA
eukprot:scaffold23518_cov225-Skeletonema_marinoi.AAC.13